MTSGPERDFPWSVGIVGLGVVGGSLALDLSAAGVEVHGYDVDPSGADRALAEGAVSRLADSADSLVGRCDIVCYAVPLDVLTRMLGAHRGLWGPEAVVTDVASLKTPVMRAAAEAGIGDRFVGSHPMAGSHGHGFGAARRGLFRGARVWLTVGAGADEAVERVEALWGLAGAETLRTEPDVHDRRMIAASHLPQVLSSLLAVVLESRGTARSDLGPGGRDMTRLAGSTLEMWLPLLRESAPDLANLLRDFVAGAGGLAEALESGDEAVLEDLFARAGAWEAGP